MDTLSEYTTRVLAYLKDPIQNHVKYNKRAETLRRMLNSLPENKSGSSAQDSETSSNNTTQDVTGSSEISDSSLATNVDCVISTSTSEESASDFTATREEMSVELSDLEKILECFNVQKPTKHREVEPFKENEIMTAPLFATATPTILRPPAAT